MCRTLPCTHTNTHTHDRLVSPVLIVRAAMVWKADIFGVEIESGAAFARENPK